METSSWMATRWWRKRQVVQTQKAREGPENLVYSDFPCNRKIIFKLTPNSEGSSLSQSSFQMNSTVIDPSTSMSPQVPLPAIRRKSVHFEQPYSESEGQPETLEREVDENEAYFRRENEEYIDYWTNPSLFGTAARNAWSPDQWKEWGELQDSWDSFESTTWGVKPLANYQFQPHNPYLINSSSQSTRHHMMHEGTRSLAEVFFLSCHIRGFQTHLCFRAFSN